MMGQNLILPINSAKLTASWKTDRYKNDFGFEHYGADLISVGGTRTVWASGGGTVLAAGWDNVVGNVIAVLYPNAHKRTTGETRDVVFRYFHLDEIKVSQGDEVFKGTVLGTYGNTGQFSTGAHLHVESDTDTEHPLYSPTVNSSDFLKGRVSGANDKTMSNPLDWLYVASSVLCCQTWATAGDKFIRDEDKVLPVFTLPLFTLPIDDGIRIEGIDVSVHNGVVDWPKVKAAGKEFAFIRLGWAGWDGHIEANGGLDKRFHENMKGAIAAGLHVGVYVYSYCKTPEAAKVAALETLELVEPYKLTYPIAFDIEDTKDSGVRYDKMSKQDNSDIAAVFLVEILLAGYYPTLYTYKDFAENYLDMPLLHSLVRCDTWIAHYANECTYEGEHTIWQYKGDAVKDKAGNIIHPAGSCPGVTGICDLNVCYKDYAAVIADEEAEPPTDDESDYSSPWDYDPLKPLTDEIEVLREENAQLREKLARIVELCTL